MKAREPAQPVDLHEDVMLADLEGLTAKLSAIRTGLRRSSLEHRDSGGYTPLIRCASMSIEADAKFLAVARALIDAGADLNAQTPIDREQPSGGWSALYVATMYGNRPMMRLLLEAGADPDLTTADGWTPLRQAVQHQEIALIALLLEAGASAAVSDTGGKTPADAARERLAYVTAADYGERWSEDQRAAIRRIREITEELDLTDRDLTEPATPPTRQEIDETISVARAALDLIERHTRRFA